MATLKEKIEQLKEEISSYKQNSAEEIEKFRLKFLSKKGEISELFDQFRTISAEEKKELGQMLNQLKQTATEKYNTLKDNMAAAKENSKKEDDLTRPSYDLDLGSRHPISLIRNEIISIFGKIGFSVAEGPEIEDDDHVFTKLNFAPEHPARDMQDTFYINENVLMRTHTSPVQAHAMEAAQGKPIRIICPGKTYRRDDDDATHSHQFAQVEGLVIDKDINIGHLKSTLELFAKKMFGEKREIRLRSSYFPFTEPSVEVDISCANCGGKGCSMCKGTGYIEILGGGMVHPNVLKMNGYDPEVYSGFAFGIGIDRTAMLRYGIDDVRKLYTNDVRFIRQFKKMS